jgi:mono/diheme cytochrome c family protein
MKTLSTVVLTLVGVALVCYAYLLSGWYNIGATAHHNALTLSVLDLTLDRSVAHHASGLQTPATVQEPATLRAGARLYSQRCQGCHGAPGIKPGATSMYPQAPDLTKEANEWSVPQLFWIVKNGIKMSGMPKYEGTLKDEEIWAIATFTAESPKLNPAQYQDLSFDSTAVAPH